MKGADESRNNSLYGDWETILELMRRQKLFYGITLKLTRNNYRKVLDPSSLKKYYDKGCRLFLYVENMLDFTSMTPERPDPAQHTEIVQRIEKIRKTIPAFHLTLPSLDDRYGGCLAAGRGFVHVSAGGNLEPCPYVPYSDTSILNTSLKDALNSSFLDSIRVQHHLINKSEHGCLLRHDNENTE